MTSRLLVDKLEGKTTANTIDLPSGCVVQVTNLASTPISGRLESSSTSFVASNLEGSITPKFSDSLIIIRFNFLFGGNNSSNITNFRVVHSTDNYSSTEVVSSLTTEGSRSFVHGSMRLVDYDVNDRHTTEICCRHLPGNTSARTYTLQQFTESSDTKYFHASATNNSGCSSQPFTVTLMEIGR